MCMTNKAMGGSGALGALAATYLTRHPAPTNNDTPIAKVSRGSARRKLWELSPGAPCPVTGVCLRFEELGRLARRAGLLDVGPTEYELHVAVVSECRRRTPLAEQVQRELDRRYDLFLRKSLKLKTEEALAHWWDECAIGTDWAGVFWAVLTHPRCGEDLEFVILGQVHMLQHQVGMAARVDHTRLGTLVADNQRMAKALEEAHQRLTLQAQALARQTEHHEAELMRLRADHIRATTGQEQALAQLEGLKREMPELENNQRLAEDYRRLQDQNRLLRRALTQGNAAPQETPESDEGGALDQTEPVAVSAPSEPVMSVQDRSVLCVGGRSRSVPMYREVVEERGARFLHHDGGSEDRVGQLGAMLQAADLVVCQVGCVSHDAYWRVKEHCKRHNKPCLFVETPSRSAIERALRGTVSEEAIEENTGSALSGQ